MADYVRTQSSDIKLLKTEFRATCSSPHQLDIINFNFSFKIILSDWVILEDSTEPVFVRQLNRGSIIDIAVPVSLEDFINCGKAREAIDRVVRQILRDDDDMIQFALLKAFKVLVDMSKPRDPADVLDLHFGVLVDNRLVYDQRRAIIEESEPRMVPASESSIESILKRKVIIDNDMEMMTCSICLEDFTEGLISMPCSHVFHGDCITQWLRTSHYCPICRFQMPTSSN
ncbi:hypothetical protein DH2020_045571 [Rehmannia glutinosa]|uniref:RING-type E3 ubiquitin transferase n=1 Tax=Rehmannia glutinosa TaxID=99300 RepID=A0ABR0UEW1_REHGL